MLWAMGEDEQSLHCRLHKTGAILHYEHNCIAAGGLITCSTKACLLLASDYIPFVLQAGVSQESFLRLLLLLRSLRIKPSLGNFLESPEV